MIWNHHCHNSCGKTKKRLTFILTLKIRYSGHVIDRKLDSCTWVGRNIELILFVSIYVCKIYFILFFPRAFFFKKNPLCIYDSIHWKIHEEHAFEVIFPPNYNTALLCTDTEKYYIILSKVPLFFFSDIRQDTTSFRHKYAAIKLVWGEERLVIFVNTFFIKNCIPYIYSFNK